MKFKFVPRNSTGAHPSQTVEKIIHVPVEKIVHVDRIKHVEVPVEVIKYIDAEPQIVYVDRPVEIIKEISVPAEPQVIYVDRIVEAPAPAPIIQYIEKEIIKDGPVQFIDRIKVVEKFKAPLWLVGALMIETLAILFLVMAIK